jgi:transposase
LYSWHVTAWRAQRGAGELAGLTPRKRGRKATKRRDEVALENQRLVRQVARLEHQLTRARKVIEVQKKISEILGVDQTLPDELKDDES